MQHIPEKWNCPFEKTSKRKERMFIENNMEKRCTAGFLAILLGCSSLLTGTGSAMAAPLEQAESKEETQAEDITIKQGETFDPASDFKGITVKDGEKLSFVLSADREGKLFDEDRPGTYDCIYQVQKQS